MTFSEKLQRLRDEFGGVADPQERLSLVVDRARRVLPLENGERIERYRVPGCVSAVWLVPELREGKCFFRGDATGPVVRGLVIFLCVFYEDASPSEILQSGDDPLVTIGIAAGLSPTRRNGMAAFRAAILNFAHAVVQDAGAGTAAK